MEYGRGVYSADLGPFSSGDYIEYWIEAIDNSLNENSAIENNSGQNYSFTVGDSDLIAPITGTIDAVNEELESKPELLNEDPYGEGWILIVVPTNLDEDLKKILNFDAAVEWHKELAKEG